MEIIIKDKQGKIKARRGKKRVRDKNGNLVIYTVNPKTNRWRKGTVKEDSDAEHTSQAY